VRRDDQRHEREEAAQDGEGENAPRGMTRPHIRFDAFA
jgi:hypothetical protein